MSSSSTQSSPQTTSSNDNGGGNNNNPSTFTCAICMEVPAEPVVTFCGHMYCWPCLFRWMQATSGQVMTAGGPASSCPVCKSAVTTETVIPLYGRGNDSRGGRAGGAGGAGASATNSSTNGSSNSSNNNNNTGSRAASTGEGESGEGAIPARPQAQRTETTEGGRYGGRGGGGGGGGFEAANGGGFNNVNVHFSAGFGFFPSLFGLQFQTIGIWPPRGASAPFSPEETHHQFLERVLLSVGTLIIFFMLFL
jgi:hypothetical protein